MTHHRESTAVDEPTGMLPSQWFVRVLGVAVVALALAALAGSRDGIQRYIRMSRM